MPTPQQICAVAGGRLAHGCVLGQTNKEGPERELSRERRAGQGGQGREGSAGDGSGRHWCFPGRPAEASEGWEIFEKVWG